MEKSICPRCDELILSFGDSETSIKCLKCGTTVCFDKEEELVEEEIKK